MSLARSHFTPEHYHLSTMARPLIVNEKIRIPKTEISLSFVRSAGPGGQNVNKVNSKAVLRWNVAASASLPEDVKSRFFQRFSHRINQSGELVMASDRYRNQLSNVSDCYEKLRHLIEAVLVAPRKRVKTRPSRSSVERRLQEKRTSSQKKQRRQFRPDDED
jgi:ribosome-associated protein